ncbi:MAG TPA: GAF domain-containing protein [Thermoleophilaceae bacterium]
MESQLEAVLEEQEALRRVATLVAGDTPAARVFARVCEEVGRVLGVESTNILRFESERRQTIVGAWAENGAPWFAAGEIVPVDGETVAGKLIRSGTPERVDDYSDVTGELVKRLKAVGISSAVGAPIIVAGGLWGALVASSGRAHAFAEGAELRLADFAELVTAALANVDAREKLAASRARIVEAGYEERRRLGRDLHDGAQQELVRAAISLRLAQQRWEQAPSEARELVAEALEQTHAGIRDLRELAAGIHPSVLTDRGLGAALTTLAGRAPMPVEVGRVPSERLPAAVESTAYFVVAEALTNAAKHSRCDRAEVSVRAGEEWITVEVRDDGVGGAEPAAGSGLRGLSDRVSALGGVLDVSSPVGEGTTIRARIAA